MVNETREIPKALMVGGAVISLVGCATLLSSAISLKVESPNLESIPNPIFHNFDSVTAKLANSGMILFLAGFVIMLAGACYAEYAKKGSNSNTLNNNKEDKQGQETEHLGSDSLSLNLSK